MIVLCSVHQGCNLLCAWVLFADKGYVNVLGVNLVCGKGRRRTHWLDGGAAMVGRKQTFVRVDRVPNSNQVGSIFPPLIFF